MKKKKLPRRLRAALLAGILAYYWLFPQALFRDCIRVVFPEAAKKETGGSLTEEDYLDLFHLQTSDYRIAFWFFRKDNEPPA